ncbi:hypothetical protein [Klebsiella phage vB_KpnS_IME279]|uniref:Uncharacterized protein n=1 Tax=Klebsiella phage vB_KpnS_IME279 TaxID=2041211 RepID=A0A291LBD8_9CAUD|nr:hypothetical protein HOS15_gp49 [Klebsiella phage vB_KpnS_IME279]ATI16443.1 hypothetical protein [Klebsiella phage vB_KpnS_IME279]
MTAGSWGDRVPPAYIPVSWLTRPPVTQSDIDRKRAELMRDCVMYFPHDERPKCPGIIKALAIGLVVGCLLLMLR